jgi:hypothetical protein
LPCTWNDLDYFDFGEHPAPNQTTKGSRPSGILILPIYCLFLSMHGFLCTS